jgi:accessory colonization factor AcfC
MTGLDLLVMRNCHVHVNHALESNLSEDEDPTLDKIRYIVNDGNGATQMFGTGFASQFSGNEVVVSQKEADIATGL